MAFAIGFVVLGLACFVIFAALSFLFGFALKCTFTAIWFVVVGLLIAIINICKFVTGPRDFFRKKGVA